MTESSKFQHFFNFESYGVVIRIESNLPDMLVAAKEVVTKALIGKVKILDEDIEAPHSFGISLIDGRYEIYRDGEYLSSGSNEKVFFKYFDSMVRSRVTEHAKGLMFVHAGVVGWKGRAVIIPARSGKGKTTLVSELIRCGAEYYSDEYAVLDEKGMNHPFARPLSFKIKESGALRLRDVEAAHFQAAVGTVAIPVGMVILTGFDPQNSTNIELVSQGTGILETIDHTIPFAIQPENSLKVLKTALSRAIILKGTRGDAKQFARSVISFFDYHLDSRMAERSVESFFGGDNEQPAIPYCS